MPLIAARRSLCCVVLSLLLLLLLLLAMLGAHTAEGTPVAATTSGEATTDIFQRICGTCDTDRRNCPDICIKEPNPNLG